MHTLRYLHTQILRTYNDACLQINDAQKTINELSNRPNYDYENSTIASDLTQDSDNYTTLSDLNPPLVSCRR